MRKILCCILLCVFSISSGFTQGAGCLETKSCMYYYDPESGYPECQEYDAIFCPMYFVLDTLYFCGYGGEVGPYIAYAAASDPSTAQFQVLSQIVSIELIYGLAGFSQCDGSEDEWSDMVETSASLSDDCTCD